MPAGRFFYTLSGGASLSELLDFMIRMRQNANRLIGTPQPKIMNAIAIGVISYCFCC